MIHSNKIKALIEQVESGKMETDIKKILKEIMSGPKKIDYFTKNFGMHYSTVTARISDLCDMGLVKKNIDPLGSYSYFSYVKDESEQLKLRELLEAEKKEVFIQRGIEKGWIQTTEYGYYFFQSK